MLNTYNKILKFRIEIVKIILRLYVFDNILSTNEENPQIIICFINFKNCCKMAKRHDENNDLRSINKIGRVNYGDKTIRVAKSTVIGIRRWGKIDFLTKHCGWILIYDNSAKVSNFVSDTDKQHNRDIKKAKKEPKLKDKSKRK